VAVLVADGVGDGVAVGVSDGVGDGEAVDVPEGSGDGSAVGVAVGMADGDGEAAESDGARLGSGDALAGRMKAIVRAVIAGADCTLVAGPAGTAADAADVSIPSPNETAIAAAAPAAMTLRTVRARRFAPRSRRLRAPTNIHPPKAWPPGHTM
jgi:hypothetical protein